jgi:hypothetical protein
MTHALFALTLIIQFGIKSLRIYWSPKVFLNQDDATSYTTVNLNDRHSTAQGASLAMNETLESHLQSRCHIKVQFFRDKLF